MERQIFLRTLQDAFLSGGKAVQQEVQEELSIALPGSLKQSPDKIQILISAIVEKQHSLMGMMLRFHIRQLIQHFE